MNDNIDHENAVLTRKVLHLTSKVPKEDWTEEQKIYSATISISIRPFSPFQLLLSRKKKEFLVWHRGFKIIFKWGSPDILNQLSVNIKAANSVSSDGFHVYEHLSIYFPLKLSQIHLPDEMNVSTRKQILSKYPMIEEY
jgi:hypothetical protein